MAKNKTTFFAEATLNLHTAEAFFFINEALFDATQEIVGFEAVERARELAPVLKEATKEREPGELRDSIDARINRVSSGRRTGVRARITTNCGYGGFVELGTARTAAEPYIWPAFEQVMQSLPEAVKANLASYTASGDAGKKG